MSIRTPHRLPNAVTCRLQGRKSSSPTNGITYLRTMNMPHINRLCLLLFLFSCRSIFGFAQGGNVLTDSYPPKYELRGVWVSTVVNLDWPSKKGLSVEQQKAEFIRLAEAHKRLGMNALFVQIRPAGDAFYPSQYDPWSEYLTGRQGQAPVPFYDPLKFMIEETHRLGMEFHAWINPYRSVFDINNSSVAADHITRRHPEWFVTYGKNKIFNPGLPETIKYVTGVVKDILNRYDIDGIHMDDYFYPYPINNQPFNDADAYRKYGKGLSLADWRRANCDSIISAIHNAVLEVNPMVKFGVSPFGVYRNKSQSPDGSDTRALSNYDDLYADILVWLKNGWVDYVAPQLYWEIGNSRADFATLVKWWSQHVYGRHLYIGEGIYRTGENSNAAWRNTNEMPNHIKLTRSYGNAIQGSIFFSSKDVLANRNGWADSLRLNYYRKPAIVPPMSWINDVNPDAPELWASIAANGQLVFSTLLNKPHNEEEVKSFIVYYAADAGDLGKSPDQILPVENAEKEFRIPLTTASLPTGTGRVYVAVSTLDRDNNESALSNIILLERQNNGYWKFVNGH